MEASVEDLDKDLFDQIRQKTGFEFSDEELLQHYRLAEPRNGVSPRDDAMARTRGTGFESKPKKVVGLCPFTQGVIKNNSLEA